MPELCLENILRRLNYRTRHAVMFASSRVYGLCTGPHASPGILGPLEINPTSRTIGGGLASAPLLGFGDQTQASLTLIQGYLTRHLPAFSSLHVTLSGMARAWDFQHPELPSLYFRSFIPWLLSIASDRTLWRGKVHLHVSSLRWEDPLAEDVGEALAPALDFASRDWLTVTGDVTSLSVLRRNDILLTGVAALHVDVSGQYKTGEMFMLPAAHSADVHITLHDGAMGSGFGQGFKEPDLQTTIQKLTIESQHASRLETAGFFTEILHERTHMAACPLLTHLIVRDAPVKVLIGLYSDLPTFIRPSLMPGHISSRVKVLELSRSLTIEFHDLSKFESHMSRLRGDLSSLTNLTSLSIKVETAITLVGRTAREAGGPEEEEEERDALLLDLPCSDFWGTASALLHPTVYFENFRLPPQFLDTVVEDRVEEEEPARAQRAPLLNRKYVWNSTRKLDRREIPTS